MLYDNLQFVTSFEASQLVLKMVIIFEAIWLWCAYIEHVSICERLRGNQAFAINIKF